MGFHPSSASFERQNRLTDQVGDQFGGKLFPSKCSPVTEQKPQSETVEFGFRTRMIFTFDHATIPMQAVVIAACEGPHKRDSGRNERLISPRRRPIRSRRRAIADARTFPEKDRS